MKSWLAGNRVPPMHDVKAGAPGGGLRFICRKESLGLRHPLKSAIAAVLAVAMLVPTASAAPSVVLPNGIDGNAPTIAAADLVGNAEPEGIVDGSTIIISNYRQLTAIGTGVPVTDGDAAEDTFGTGRTISDEAGSPLTYALDATYRLAGTISMPQNGVWQLPAGFAGTFETPAIVADPGLYDQSTDTLYVHNVYQLAMLAQSDAAAQPVMSNDAEPSTFGMGQPVMKTDGRMLTYGGAANVALAMDFTTATPQGEAGQITLNDAAAGSDPDTTSNDDAVSPQAEGDENTEPVDPDGLDGRDYVGQVTKKINDTTYILIGNEQQLRAIGSDVAVNQKVFHYYAFGDHEPTEYYAGDADLTAGQEVRGEEFGEWGLGSESGYKYCGQNSSGQPDRRVNANTGLTYSATANYIIFRDINLTGADWEPLMFSGVMIGAKSASPDVVGSLWSCIDSQNADVTGSGDSRPEQPVISNVVINQKGDTLDVDKQQGIGFFASITSDTEMTTSGGSKGYGGIGSSRTVSVANIALSNVTVDNNAVKAKLDVTLGQILGLIVGDLAGGLLSLLEALFTGDYNSGINDLLNALQDDPSSFATGAFAGRLYGSVKVTGCSVSDVSVSSDAAMTGGFVGYSEGATRYDFLTDKLAALTGLLTSILNLIPFLGLGDLIDWLLNTTLGLDSLIPVEYYNPQITDCSVSNFKAGTTLGNADSDYAGGFIGNQIGTIIDDCSVKSANPYTVQAKEYAGGFAGLARNGEVGGLLNSLGVEIVAFLKPQSAIINSTLGSPESEGDAGQQASATDVSVSAASYAGGFVGAMANSYAVNDAIDNRSMSVNATSTDDGAGYAGGFTGRATVGWGIELGSKQTTSLLGQLSDVVSSLLTGDASGNALLSVAGVKPSAILGAQMSGSISVDSAKNYAGGIVGGGSAVVIGTSSEDNLGALTFWDASLLYDGSLELDVPTQQDTVVTGLSSVHASGSYAGGVAGNLQPAAVAAILNDTLGLGSLIGEGQSWNDKFGKYFDSFASFDVSNVSLSGPADGGVTVSADDFYAGGAIGFGTGGDVVNTTISNVGKISAEGDAGGFFGFAGPGDTVGAGGLDVLGLVKVSGVLSVAQYSSVEVTNSSVEGIASGFTVTATGKNDAGENATFAAGGFFGQANSTNATDCHVKSLSSVVADKSENAGGVAGGFVGYSTTGGLAEALGNEGEASEILGDLSLINLNDLLGAVPYLVPTYRKTDVTFVNDGVVKADVAGGFAGDFQSGEVNQFSKKDLEDDPSLVDVKTSVEANPWAVINIARVEGGAYAGGFGGIVEAGSLANAADGGLSILGGLVDNVSVLGLKDLLGLIQAYVPYISYAGVHTDGITSGQAETTNYGLKVTADRIDSTDLNAGSAGGYIGYGAAVQISHSSVDQLVYTKVTEPADLEGADGSSYFREESDYAVSAPRYAGGYVGYMDIGDTAGAVDGLSVLGDTDLEINLSNLLSALNVVASMIEYSDVYGAAGGYAVLASGNDEQTGAIGHAGGYAGLIAGGHTQNSNAYNFSHIIGQICAGGYVGELEPGSVAKVLDSADVGENGLLNGLLDVNDLLSLVNAFVPSVRNSVTTSIPCGGVVRAQAASGEVTVDDVSEESGKKTISTQRGMAGGFVGHNEGGQIEGNNRDTWKDTDGDYILNNYDGPIQSVEAVRIRSVWGAEYAGGFTGLMESASTAKAGSLSLLWGLVKADNLLGALQAIYPTEDNTAVWGPLRKLTVEEWNNWVGFVGVNGGYGSSLYATGKISDGTDSAAAQEQLDKLIDSYAYGTNVVAGRSTFEQSPITADGGVAGGYVGSMITGVITNGQAHDTKLVRAMRAAGGFTGAAVTGGAASLGGVSLLDLNLNLDQLLGAARVFVPTIKNSSVVGYRMGMTVTSFGAPAEGDDSQHKTDIKRGTGNAGGYIGYGSGVQIWGDEKGGTNDGTTELEGIGCTVSGLRRVTASAYAGGFAGKLTSGAMANVSTNVSDGFLQSLLDSLVSTTGINNLVQVLQTSMSTVRRAGVRAYDEENNAGDAAWGYTVEGYSANGSTIYPIAAGGFAGMIEATVLGELGPADGSQDRPELPVVEEDEYDVNVAQVRGVKADFYAGGFVGLADVGGLAQVADGDTEDTGVSILGIIGLGDVTALEVFQPCIYAAHVAGVDDGLTVRARTADAGGLFGNTRRSGNAGGFAGSIMSGAIRSSSLTNLSSVSGPSYTGGFVGYTGKSGVLDASKADVLQGLLGASANVANTFSTLIENSTVAGISNGYTVASTGTDYADTNAEHANKIAGGFVGFADLAHIDNCDATALKRVSSGEVAGGFAGEGTYAYLVSVDAESPLAQILLAVVSGLVKALWLEDLQGKNVIKIELPGGEILNLNVFAEGDTLSLTLLGIDISLKLNKDEEGQTGTVVLQIGDSSVKLKVDKEGNIQNEGDMSNVAINLIKGNSSKITNSTVTGIAEGYDVFGGAATQDAEPAEGTEASVTGASNQDMGYAGGFIGLNNEAQVTGNQMVYADVVKGADGKTGPFTGATSYKSNWWFNSIKNIDNDNAYSVYRRDDGLIDKTPAGTLGTMTVNSAVKDAAGWARFDVSNHMPHVDEDGNADFTSNLSDWQNATANGEPLGVYASAGKAVLMDDTAVSDNTGGLTPEPGDGQDPCKASIDLTLQKVWNDGLFGFAVRPRSINVRIKATYGVNTVQYVQLNDDGTYELVDAAEGGTDPTIILSTDDGSPWSNTWRKVIEDLPVAIEGAGGAPQYVTYTVEELTVNGYVTTIVSDDAEKVITITNTKQGLLPDTGGMGTMWIIAAGLLLIGVGLVWQWRNRRHAAVADTGRHGRHRAK